MPDISAVLNAHREGMLAGPSIGSYFAAIAHARANGLTVETVVILDRPDPLTLSIFNETNFGEGCLHITDCGDPGLARNFGVAESSGEFVTFLDGDDLWSFNWLTRAHAFSKKAAKPLVAHSEFNIAFGAFRHFWVHADSEAPHFDSQYLGIGNYWDAMSFAPRSLYEAHPFRANDIKGGYGHEDWHWNCVTLLAGYPHRPVPDTVHMKRKRANSQLALCADNDVVIWPTALALYEPRRPDREAARPAAKKPETPPGAAG